MLAALAGMVLTLDMRAEGLILVEDGKPETRIVLGDDVPPFAKFAARELQDYVKKSTGATLPIEDGLKNDGLAEIVLGDGSIARGLGLTTAGLTPDAFYMRVIGKRLVIVGKDDPRMDPAKTIVNWFPFRQKEHATLFGVYELLERYIGVRWYLPLDELGEVVPKKQTVTVPDNLDLHQSPNYIGRNTHLSCGRDDRDERPADFGGGGWIPDQSSDPDKPTKWKDPDWHSFNRRRNLFSFRMRSESQSCSRAHSMTKLVPSKKYAQAPDDSIYLRRVAYMYRNVMQMIDPALPDWRDPDVRVGSRRK
ncbi:MAG: hypothetical protein JXR37_21515 [Kiritimatiellae bacterium]|nr:hypothetical protein [Kiritimatiellia bacterium]